MGTSITIPSSVVSIENSAFYCSVNLTNLVIPDNVTTIKNSAFMSCASLTSVEIGAGLTNLSPTAFSLCGKLVSIIVDKENTVFRSIDDNLYSKDARTLLLYARGKADTEFVIPNHVTCIGASAFFSCKDLTSIIFHDNVVEIQACAFKYCSNIRELTLPSSLKVIGEYAFANCAKTVRVRFKGTLSQWHRIDIAENCNDGTEWIITCSG